MDIKMLKPPSGQSDFDQRWKACLRYGTDHSISAHFGQKSSFKTSWLAPHSHAYHCFCIPFVAASELWIHRASPSLSTAISSLASSEVHSLKVGIGMPLFARFVLQNPTRRSKTSSSMTSTVSSCMARGSSWLTGGIKSYSKDRFKQISSWHMRWGFDVLIDKDLRRERWKLLMR